jgi:hypothetical protein
MERLELEMDPEKLEMDPGKLEMDPGKLEMDPGKLEMVVVSRRYISLSICHRLAVVLLDEYVTRLLFLWNVLHKPHCHIDDNDVYDLKIQ